MEIITVLGMTKMHPSARANSPTSAESDLVSLSSLSALSAAFGGFAANDPRVVAALEEYLEALRAGRPCAKAAFLAGHADIADELGKCLSALEFIHGAAAQLGGPQDDPTGNPTNSIPRRSQLGDYRIVREVGRGGMGVVYEAEQVSLGRRVALKVLPFAAAIDPKQRQRFQIEAQAAAQLHHPHIVPIFSVGCEHGIHYYVMQFVDGRSLAAVLRELRHGADEPVGREPLNTTTTVLLIPAAPPPAAEPAALPDEPQPGAADLDWNALTRPQSVSAASPESPAPGPELPTPTPIGSTHQDRAFCRNVARLGAEAAGALDHAHGLGIVHRDIKPANLLIDPHGALWITDFGLARFSSDLSLTHTGEMVGTLRYMSPEQAQARRGVVDQRTDIYSLGVTLYELLTLQPAFDGRDHQELLRQIALDEPPSPRRLNSAIPSDLETIVLKAMAKDPASRYATALELAADLQRFIDDQPILARRPGIVERTRRWARRHKELVATAAVIFVLALTISSAAIWNQARKTELHAREAERADRRRVTFLRDTYPELHRVGTSAIGEAISKLYSGPADPAKVAEASQVFEKWQRYFEQAIELPPDDPESRAVIARAYSRLGYANWMMSGARGTPKGPDSRLLTLALADYHKSVDLLEKLLAESPGDPKVRRYLAEALGLGNMGCCMRSARQSEEAEPFYRRAIEIRSELLRGTGGNCVGNPAATTTTPGELEDLVSLVSTVHFMAGMMESKGLSTEAARLREQLTADVNAAAALMSDVRFKDVRRRWASTLTTGMLPFFDRSSRGRDWLINQRLALILDPEHPTALNNLAWSLTGDPGEPWFNPAEALTLARKAVALEPNEWAFLNTLGVAAFRRRLGYRRQGLSPGDDVHRRRGL